MSSMVPELPLAYPNTRILESEKSILLYGIFANPDPDRSVRYRYSFELLDPDTRVRTTL